ncbi:sulfite exporter TauE/SafE family protein [Psychrobium sp. nBUS_13]|uniref:sulfite exporter TauE/SafE family protein n=1 Tax=Psychrobium sp. nBUS_13 TaxID=3395319 RepID=UPI003EBBBB6B
MSDYDFWAALTVGLLSAGHCFGMCGGVVGAFSANLPLHHRLSHVHRIQYVLAYNIGRIASYCLAGALIGYSVGYFALKSSILLYVLQLIAGIMLVSIGLYLANWFNLVRKIEVIGKQLWPIISPIANKFVPFKSPLSALPFGMIWGWLPCGLVYSTLTWSAASGSAASGALIMLGFGLGTLPALFSMGYFSQQLKTLLTNKYVRVISALVIISYGLFMISKTLLRFLN